MRVKWSGMSMRSLAQKIGHENDGLPNTEAAGAPTLGKGPVGGQDDHEEDG